VSCANILSKRPTAYNAFFAYCNPETRHARLKCFVYWHVFSRFVPAKASIEAEVKRAPVANPGSEPAPPQLNPVITDA
jgi:hypothetical protein